MASYSEVLHYHVVILTASGGVISRHCGTDLPAAILRAQEVRKDHPTAKEVRVVHPDTGVCYTN